MGNTNAAQQPHQSPPVERKIQSTKTSPLSKGRSFIKFGKRKQFVVDHDDLTVEVGTSTSIQERNTSNLSATAVEVDAGKV
uniref:Uncharacterized protein n=1 Tax=Anopheles albimanus TaxID=7167 RepID=A0A182FQF2_ANOAL